MHTITTPDQDMNNDTQLTIWQDVKVQLFELVRATIAAAPSLNTLGDKELEELVQPFLKRIEKDVETRLMDTENRIRQAREDERAEMKEKEDIIWKETKTAEFNAKLRDTANLVVGHKSRVCWTKTSWCQHRHIMALAGNVPFLSALTVSTTPAATNELSGSFFWYDDPLSSKYNANRPTITVEGCPPGYEKLFVECNSMDDMIQMIAHTTMSIALPDYIRLSREVFEHSNLNRVLSNLEPLLRRRHIMCADLIAFFQKCTTSFTTFGEIARVLEAYSLDRGHASKRIELLNQKRA